MIRVTRLEESDGGTEARVEVELGGVTVELVVCDGMFGRTVDLWQLGPHRYADGEQLCQAKLNKDKS